MSERRVAGVMANDLKKKMVFIAGPRQCGKTTLTKDLAKKSRRSWTYYNWDIDADKRRIMASEVNPDSYLWIFDELHKFRRWRNWLKGLYDQHQKEHAMLVTGSAKLEAFSRGGDSLQGRYFMHRLHPLTLSELINPKSTPSWQAVFSINTKVSDSAREILSDLLTLGGFPEPFFSQSKREAARWRLAYGSLIIRDEIRSLEQVQNLDGMQLLLERLPVTVGSVLSINSLREDLGVAFETARNWLAIFERLFTIIRISPFGAPRIKAVKKEQKLYFWDWARAETEAARLENLVAIHLLRFVHWQEDVEGEKWELRYFRDKAGHEVDFILVHRGTPVCAIEVKAGDSNLDTNLKYLLERVKIPYAFQISLGQKDYMPPPINGCKIRILPAHKFLAQLY